MGLRGTPPTWGQGADSRGAPQTALRGVQIAPREEGATVTCASEEAEARQGTGPAQGHTASVWGGTTSEPKASAPGTDDGFPGPPPAENQANVLSVGPGQEKEPDVAGSWGWRLFATLF